MTSWTELMHLDCTFICHPLVRDHSVLEAYHEKLEEPNFRKTFSDYIKYNMTNLDYVLRENDFPYKTDPNIEHLVFWFNGGNYTMSEAKQVILRITSLKTTDVVVCCNVPRLKSIPGIPHYQVFLRTTLRCGMYGNHLAASDLESTTSL
jgi:hypothetical protein